MENVPDLLDDTRRGITERMKELRPLVDEFERLEAAASALAGVGTPAVARGARRVTRRRGAPPARPGGTGAGPHAGGGRGARADRAKTAKPPAPKPPPRRRRKFGAK